MNPERIANIGKRWLPHVIVVLTYWNYAAFQGGSIVEAHHLIALILILGVVELISALCTRWPLTQQLLVSLTIILWLDTQLNYYEFSLGLLSAVPFSTAGLFGLIAILLGLSLFLLLVIQKRIGAPFYLFTFVTFSFLALIVAGTNLARGGISPSAGSRIGFVESGGPTEFPVANRGEVIALPPVLNGKSLVQIVFDAHGSLGEDPADAARAALIKRSAQELLLDRGFVLGTEVFSRYFQTHDSVGNTINFSINREHKKFFDDGANLVELKLFEQLSASGYEGHVFQSTWLNFCEARAVRYRTCQTYTGESVVSLISMIPDMLDRLRISLASYVVGLPLPNKMLVFYARVLAPRLPDALPTFRSPAGPLSLMAFDILDDLKKSVIRNAGRESFYFAHILMPHGPFSVDSSCSLRQPIGYWRQSTDPEAMKQGKENTVQGRLDSLEDYYEQLSCLYVVLDRMLSSWDEAGVLDSLVIVMHGDHGSRVSLNWPKSADQPSTESTQNDRDNFLTHFTYRIAGNLGRVDGREVALQDWFAELFGVQIGAKYGRTVFVRDTLTSTRGIELNPRPYFGFDQP